VAGTLLVALVAANLRVVWHTHAEIERSGGRGYWSDAVVGFAEEVAGSPGTRVVCLDWGLHNQVAFLGEGVRSLDAIWQVRRELARGEAWSFAGDAGTVYLIHPEPFDLFGLGVRFQSALEGVPEDRVDLRPHFDREGGVAFLAVRLKAPTDPLRRKAIRDRPRASQYPWPAGRRVIGRLRAERALGTAILAVCSVRRAPAEATAHHAQVPDLLERDGPPKIGSSPP
jgi:hypothetical protein